jgi:tetratricopeptide (TPR) repeat protein
MGRPRSANGVRRNSVTALAAALALACAAGPTGEAERRLAAGDLDGARATLEAERERNPRSADVRVGLGEVYYRIARDALDRDRDEARYLTYLEKSVAEFVTAAEFDPRNEQPHFYLAVMDVYRGKPRQALRGLDNVRRLRGVGLDYTNIAELYVYLGRLDQARDWNDLGVRKGAPYGAAVFNDMLIAWKADELDEARRHFAWLRSQDPDMLRTINAAPLPEDPRSFEAFAGYCCGSPGCGPYMRDACRDLDLEVQEREVSEEAVLRELRIEMERTRRLRKVYEQRKELEVEIENPPPAEP